MVLFYNGLIFKFDLLFHDFHNRFILKKLNFFAAIVLSLVFFGSLTAQEETVDSTDLIQFSGLVLDGVGEELEPIPFVTVSVEGDSRGVYTDWKKNTARINAEAMKTSAGALSKIPVCREQNVMKALEYLQLSGVSIASSDLKATKKVSDVDFTGPVAILIGSEGRGVHYTLSEKADETFIIPQKGTTDSLNVSVATGVILYEASRQRG